MNFSKEGGNYTAVISVTFTHVALEALSSMKLKFLMQNVMYTCTSINFWQSLHGSRN